MIEKLPLRPIRSDRQWGRASKLAIRLATQPRLNRDAQDYLEVLSQLIAAYEGMHHSIEPDASPREMLQFLIDENGLTLTQLAAEAGIPASTLSGILQGKREFKVQHIARLAARFQVEPNLFIERVALRVKD